MLIRDGQKRLRPGRRRRLSSGHAEQSNPLLSVTLTLSALCSKLAEEPPLFWVAHRHRWSLEWPCPCSRAGLAQVLLESFQSDEKSPSFPLPQDGFPRGQCVLASRRQPCALDAWAGDTCQPLPSQVFPGLLRPKPVTSEGTEPLRQWTH